MKKVELHRVGLYIFFILSLSLMFLGFYRNQWHAARPKRFSTFQKDVEGYVLARIMLSRQSGIFSEGGLLGWMDVDPQDVNQDDYENQYDIYLNDLTFTTYWPKKSHSGFQGIFFSILDLASPFSSSNNLRLFRMFASGLFAATLSGFIVWFYREFGWLSAIFVLASILSSQWMTVFGRNLFFVSGLFYLPTLILLFRFSKEKTGTELSYIGLFRLVFIFILIKCLFNGYDFILPTLGMVASPVIYFGIQENWNKEKFTKRFLIVVSASLLAILASFLILSVQVTAASGNFQNGFESILTTIKRRVTNTSTDISPVYQEANNASTWLILKIYLRESYFFKFSVPYFIIIIFFAFMTVIYKIISRAFHLQKSTLSKGNALIITTWFSILGPLGWYTIFKSIAYYHTHMNYLPWHMPFTLLGFGFCGYIFQTMINQVIDKYRRFG